MKTFSLRVAHFYGFKGSFYSRAAGCACKIFDCTSERLEIERTKLPRNTGSRPTILMGIFLETL